MTAHCAVLLNHSAEWVCGEEGQGKSMVSFDQLSHAHARVEVGVKGRAVRREDVRSVRALLTARWNDPLPTPGYAASEVVPKTLDFFCSVSDF